MHDLTGFQRDLLYAIAGQESPSGLGVKADLDAYYGSEVHHGRLYPNLDELVEKGLVEKGRIDDRTNAYTLTESGEQVIRSRREWEQAHLDDETNT